VAFWAYGHSSIASPAVRRRTKRLPLSTWGRGLRGQNNGLCVPAAQAGITYPRACAKGPRLAGPGAWGVRRRQSENYPASTVATHRARRIATFGNDRSWEYANDGEPGTIRVDERATFAGRHPPFFSHCGDRLGRRRAKRKNKSELDRGRRQRGGRPRISDPPAQSFTETNGRNPDGSYVFERSSGPLSACCTGRGPTLSDRTEVFSISPHASRTPEGRMRPRVG